jgi:hypothetical protein
MESDLGNFVRTVVCSLGCSVLVGFLLFGPAVFQTASIGFQLVSFGAFGALLIATIRVVSIQKFFAAVVLIGFLYEYVITPSGFAMILRDSFNLLGITGTIILFYRSIHKRLEELPLVRPLLVAAMLALNGVVVTLLLIVVRQIFYGAITFHGGIILQSLSMGFLLGFGLGTGDELNTLLARVTTGPKEGIRD